jgi:hypothetical protein
MAPFCGLARSFRVVNQRGRTKMKMPAFLALGAALSSTATSTIGAASAIPALDYKKGCQSASLGIDVCVSQEETARKTLMEKWSSYRLADRSNCTAILRTLDQLPSYVVLLNCLDTDAEARKPMPPPAKVPNAPSR